MNPFVNIYKHRVALYLSCLHIYPFCHISSESASPHMSSLHLISHRRWRQSAGLSCCLTQQAAAVQQGGSGASDIPGICHSFGTAFGVACCDCTGSTCGWSISWGRADIKERQNCGTCTHAAALRHATELWSSAESLSRAPFSHCHTMGTNASILLLITLWASVQDGENLLTCRSFS